jgi:hypothetical protein
VYATSRDSRSKDRVFFGCVRDTDHLRAVLERILEEFVGEDGRRIGKAEDGVVSEDSSDPPATRFSTRTRHNPQWVGYVQTPQWSA